MHTIDIALGCETTGQVFPSCIQDREWVGYHGTASDYSDHIEAEGFVHGKGPISEPDIDFLANLAALHNADPDGNILGFKQLNSISFSISPLVALSYAKPGCSGGQGVEFVRKIAQVLLDPIELPLLDTEVSRLKSIVGMIERIQQSQPVIYAFDLRGLEAVEFQSVTAAIHVYSDIPSDRIIAKAFVPANIDHASIDARRAREDIRNLRYTDRHHWIHQVRRT